MGLLRRFTVELLNWRKVDCVKAIIYCLAQNKRPSVELAHALRDDAQQFHFVQRPVLYLRQNVNGLVLRILIFACLSIFILDLKEVKSSFIE